MYLVDYQYIKLFHNFLGLSFNLPDFTPDYTLKMECNAAKNDTVNREAKKNEWRHRRSTDETKFPPTQVRNLLFNFK